VSLVLPIGRWLLPHLSWAVLVVIACISPAFVCVLAIAAGEPHRSGDRCGPHASVGS
jgi:hypothetical protein